MTEQNHVWIVEEGDYEQRGVVLVAASLDAAVNEIKRMYGPPYRVAWDDLNYDDETSPCLTGHFEGVRGYSTTHTAHYSISKMPLVS